MSGTLKKHRLNVPEDDLATRKWIDAQHNLSISLRLLITDFRQKYGYVDVMSVDREKGYGLDSDTLLEKEIDIFSKPAVTEVKEVEVVEVVKEVSSAPIVKEVIQEPISQRVESSIDLDDFIAKAPAKEVTPVKETTQSQLSKSVLADLI